MRFLFQKECMLQLPASAGSQRCWPDKTPLQGASIELIVDCNPFFDSCDVVNKGLSDNAKNVKPSRRPIMLWRQTAPLLSVKWCLYSLGMLFARLAGRFGLSSTNVQVCLQRISVITWSVPRTNPRSTSVNYNVTQFAGVASGVCLEVLLKLSRIPISGAKCPGIE